MILNDKYLLYIISINIERYFALHYYINNIAFCVICKMTNVTNNVLLRETRN